MDNATYVIFARRTERGQLRDRLRLAASETVHLTERRRLGGSEFFISGPPARAREVHEAAVRWLARPQLGPT